MAAIVAAQIRDMGTLRMELEFNVDTESISDGFDRRTIKTTITMGHTEQRYTEPAILAK